MKNNSIILDSEVLIVGAGVSGLVTAYKLIQKLPSMKITIVEESSCIGGQVHPTQSMGDLGGKYISNNHYHMIKLLKDLNLDIYPKPRETRLKRKSTLNSGLFSFLINFEINIFIREIDITCRSYRFVKKTVREDSPRMESFLSKRLLFPKSKRYARLLVRLACGVDSEDATVAEFMATCSSCGSLSEIIHIYMNDSVDIHEFDTREFLDRLQEQIKDVPIYVGCKINHIVQASDHYILKDVTGNNFKAKVVVLDIPWNSVMDIYIYPGLPEELLVPYYSSRFMITSFLAQYEKAFWHEKGLSGSSFLDGDIPLFSYEVEETIIYGFLLHNEEHMSKIDKIFVCEKLSRALGSEMKNPMSFSMRGFFQSTILNVPQTSSYGHIIWGSSCSSTVYRGLLNGAVQGGLQAALNVLTILHPQTVNFEDHKEVKRADAIYDKVGWWTNLTCSINLKNSSYVILVVLGLFSIYKFRNILK